MKNWPKRWRSLIAAISRSVAATYWSVWRRMRSVTATARLPRMSARMRAPSGRARMSAGSISASRHSVSARAEAERGRPSSRAISPSVMPADKVARTRSPVSPMTRRKTVTEPLSIR